MHCGESQPGQGGGGGEGMQIRSFGRFPAILRALAAPIPPCLLCGRSDGFSAHRIEYAYRRLLPGNLHRPALYSHWHVYHVDGYWKSVRFHNREEDCAPDPSDPYLCVRCDGRRNKWLWETYGMNQPPLY